MKKMIFAIAITSVFALAVFAQTPTPPSRPSTTASAPTGGGASNAPTGGTGAEGKLAYINTAKFSTDIGELSVKITALNSEFEQKRKEVESEENALNSIKDKINKQGATVSVAVRTEWV